MSLASRSYRKELLIDKAGLNKPSAGLMDIQAYSNIQKAIEITLDSQEFHYQLEQNKKVNQLVNELKDIL